MESRTIALEDAAQKTVGEVMIHKPKTLPADALVGDVRRPSVRTVLLADDERYLVRRVSTDQVQGQ